MHRCLVMHPGDLILAKLMKMFFRFHGQHFFYTFSSFSLVIAWDVRKVFCYLETIFNSEDLTLKTVMVVSAQRGQTIHYLNWYSKFRNFGYVYPEESSQTMQSRSWPGNASQVYFISLWSSHSRDHSSTNVFGLHKMQTWW